MTLKPIALIFGASILLSATAHAGNRHGHHHWYHQGHHVDYHQKHTGTATPTKHAGMPAGMKVIIGPCVLTRGMNWICALVFPGGTPS